MTAAAAAKKKPKPMVRNAQSTNDPEERAAPINRVRATRTSSTKTDTKANTVGVAIRSAHGSISNADSPPRARMTAR